ncbi:MAG: single-stranded DNA-binding protein [Candidatus Aminicenantes bacterium 4484_214]|nr:MAG: single-stranded DNA-binding protein [Candidatus Aminicenantes bacterium 4484_214]
MRDINSLNKVILIGRLGGNPELRYLPQTERAVARFTLATNESYFNTNTNQNEVRTEWHRIVAWGRLAEFCEKYLTKGKQIYLEGKLRTRTWQDRDGNKRTTTEIETQSIVLLGRKEEMPPETEATLEGNDLVSNLPSGEELEEETPSEDDDIPF